MVSQVPWSENFVDMRSKLYPAPVTRFKMRWDDERLHVGAYLQVSHVTRLLS